MSDALARKKFTEFKERTGDLTDSELDDYWASLQPATIDGMLGEWKGGEFVTGHRMNGQLEKARWFGKTFNSPTDVQPLVCLDQDGNRFSNVKMGKGEASLWLAAKSPRPWSTTASPSTITSRRSTTTR
jgi:hypothetical protein